jgi:hypothetical protein
LDVFRCNKNVIFPLPFCEGPNDFTQYYGLY